MPDRISSSMSLNARHSKRPSRRIASTGCSPASTIPPGTSSFHTSGTNRCRQLNSTCPAPESRTTAPPSGRRTGGGGVAVDLTVDGPADLDDLVAIARLHRELLQQVSVVVHGIEFWPSAPELHARTRRVGILPPRDVVVARAVVADRAVGTMARREGARQPRVSEESRHLRRDSSDTRAVRAQYEGARDGHGAERSNCVARPNSRPSAPRSAITCTPSGIPAESVPNGTDIAGEPVQLARLV